MAETAGHRLYLVRLALGDGVRDALPIREFVAFVEAETGARYSASTISDMETGKRRLALDDVRTFASVDPLTRGREWLAWGRDEDGEDEGGAHRGARHRPPPAPAGRDFVIDHDEAETVSYPRRAAPAAAKKRASGGTKKRRGP